MDTVKLRPCKNSSMPQHALLWTEIEGGSEVRVMEDMDLVGKPWVHG